MLRRILLAVILVAILFSLIPVGAIAAGKKHVIVFESMENPVILEGSEVFRQTMVDLGYRPGIEIEYRILKAEGDKALGRKLLAEAIAERKPDLVVSLATLASMVSHELLKETSIPWLFFTVTDPVGAGIVAAENQPSGRNVSGRIYGIERAARLNMLLRLVGDRYPQRPLRIGFIHTDYPSSIGDLRQLQSAVKANPAVVLHSLQLAYQSVPDHLPAMLNKVRAAVRQLEPQIDFWWSPIGPLGERIEYARLLIEETGKPLVMATNLHGVEAGALLYLGPDVPGQAREVAGLAERVLKGEKVGTMPVTMPKAFNVGLNLRTAERLGLIIPSDILGLAEENLFR